MTTAADIDALISFTEARLEALEGTATAARHDGKGEWHPAIRPEPGEPVPFIVCDSRQVIGGGIDAETVRHMALNDPAHALRLVAFGRGLRMQYLDGIAVLAVLGKHDDSDPCRASINAIGVMVREFAKIWETHPAYPGRPT